MGGARGESNLTRIVVYSGDGARTLASGGTTVITELRRYRIRPDCLDSWLAFFREAARENERHGSRVEYAGVDTETSTFIWLRSFEDEAHRQTSKDAFYGSDWWTEREASVMSQVLGYDVTFLDAALVRTGGDLSAPAWPAAGDPAGSRADNPPAGWTTSTRRTFAPERGGR
jgi:hypothetical protein